MKKFTQKKLISLFSHQKNTFHQKQFIGTKLSALGEKKKSVNNNNNSYFEATTEEINETVSLAKEAAKSFKKEPTKNITKLLYFIQKELKQNQEKIIKTAMEETRLPQPRITGEFNRTLFQIENFAESINKKPFKDIIEFTEEGKPSLNRTSVPLGPVVVFGASNFALAYSTPGGDTMSALATKNPVIVKAHPAHPKTCEITAECIKTGVKNAGVHPGVFSMLHGEASVGGALVNHAGVQGVGFTGSISGGRALFDIATRRRIPIPVYAEMGSVNPLIILPDALKSKSSQIAEGLTGSFTLSCGQFCTNPGIVITLQDAEEDFGIFEKTFKENIAKAANQQMLTNGIQENFERGLSNLKKYTQVIQQNETKGEYVGAVSLKVSADEYLKNFQEIREEVFGPVTTVIQCTNKEQILSILKTFDGQLSSTLHATPKEEKLSQEILNEMQEYAGRIILNGFPTGVEVCSAQHHGGPYPATSDIRTGAVGATALKRWIRPITYQNFKNSSSLLPSHHFE